MKVEKVKLIIQSLLTLKYYFKDSLPLFVSSLSIQIYVNVNKLLVGSFLGMKEVAIYDMGEKISSLIKMPIGIISQAIFPKICREKNIAYINKVMWVTVGLISFLYIGIFVYADYIVVLLSGMHNTIAVDVIRILDFAAIIIVFNFFLGQNRLIPFGHKKIYVSSLLTNCSLYILGGITLYICNYFTIYSIAVLCILAEVSMLGINLYINSKYKLLKYEKNKSVGSDSML
jgi:PST family polysaccharide transporter